MPAVTPTRRPGTARSGRTGEARQARTSDARTDPAIPGAWYDRSGPEENGDKCAWAFKV